MIEADPSLAERLAYCVEKGIPLSQFDSWPELDQGLTLALLRRERAKCPGCGLSPEQTADPAHPQFIADVHICHSCLEIGRVEKQIDDKQKRGARIRWVPIEEYVPPDEEG